MDEELEEQDVDCIHTEPPTSHGQPCRLPGADRKWCPFTLMGAPVGCDRYRPKEVEQ